MSHWKTVSGRRTRRPITPLHDCTYSEMRQRYPWAQVFRAGFIIFSRVADTIKLLLVYQKAEPGLVRRRGLPKGAASLADHGVLDTALRELLEETGISADNISMQPAEFVIERSEIHVPEVVVYFVATTGADLPVTIDAAELDGYEWYDIRCGLRAIEPVAKPTARLLAVLDTMKWE